MADRDECKDRSGTSIIPGLWGPRGSHLRWSRASNTGASMSARSGAMIRALPWFMMMCGLGCGSIESPDARIIEPPRLLATDGVRPDLSNVAVVWLALTVDGRQIWKYDLASGRREVVAVLRDSVPVEPPRISDSLVVWGVGVTTDEGLLVSLFTSTVTGGEIKEHRGERNRGRPTVSEAFIAWEAVKFGEPSEIGAKSRATGEEMIIREAGSELVQPRLSGQHLVYARGLASGDVDLVLHDLETGAHQPLTTDGRPKGDAVIDGALVAWVQDDGKTLMVLDRCTGSARTVAGRASQKDDPDIDGGWLVWADDQSGDWDVFLHDVHLGKTFQISDSPDDEIKPHVNGRRVVWQRNRGRVVMGVELVDLTATPLPGESSSPAPAACPQAEGAMHGK